MVELHCSSIMCGNDVMPFTGSGIGADTRLNGVIERFIKDGLLGVVHHNTPIYCARIATAMMLTPWNHMVPTLSAWDIAPKWYGENVDIQRFSIAAINVTRWPTEIQGLAVHTINPCRSASERAIIAIPRGILSNITFSLVKEPYPKNGFGINFGIALSCKHQTNDNKTDANYG